MQENSPSRLPVLGGFALCVFFILLVAAVGLHGLRMQEQNTFELAECHDALESVQLAQRLFVTMELHAARQDHFQDSQETEVIRDLVKELGKVIEDSRRSMVSQDTAFIENVHQRVQEFVKLQQHKDDIFRKRLELMAKRNVTETIILASLDELIAGYDHFMEEDAHVEEDNARFLKESNVKLQRSLLDMQNGVERQRRLFLQISMTADPKMQQELCQSFIESFKEAELLLTKIRDEVVTQEARNGVEKTLDGYRQCRVECDEIMKILAESEYIGQMQDKISVETTELFAHLKVNMHHRTSEISEVVMITNGRLMTILMITSTIAVVFCIVTGIFVANRVSRPTSRSDTYDAYPPGSPSETPRDLSVVADKLQEVVNLLRR